MVENALSAGSLLVFFDVVFWTRECIKNRGQVLAGKAGRNTYDVTPYTITRIYNMQQQNDKGCPFDSDPPTPPATFVESSARRHDGTQPFFVLEWKDARSFKKKEYFLLTTVHRGRIIPTPRVVSLCFMKRRMYTQYRQKPLRAYAAASAFCVVPRSKP